MIVTRMFKALVLAVGLLTAASLPAGAEDLPATIRFAGFGQGFGLPFGVGVLAIGQVKGFIAEEFKDTPVKLEWSYLTGTGPAINEGIANGQYDIAQYGGLPNIIGRANGLPTKILLSYGVTIIFGVARKDLGIHSFKDLRGRRVAVAKGTIVHWALLKALEANGLSVRDVTVIDLKAADQLAALAAGSVDAAIGTSTLLAVRDQGLADIFYTSRDVGLRAAGFGAITVTEQFQSKYPEVTERIVRGLVRAAEWLSHDENREEALQIWAKSGTPYVALREEFDGLSLKEAFNPLLDDFFVNQYCDATAFSRSERLIRNDIDLNAWFAPRYLERALTALGLGTYWPRRDATGSAIN
jgi:sulfonate transport system substrate-binding protein